MSPTDPTPGSGRQRQAYATDCRWCTARVLMARTRAGRWQAYDVQAVQAEPGLHRWARGIGMVEVPTGVPGYRTHYCTQRSTVGALAADISEDLR